MQLITEESSDDILHFNKQYTNLAKLVNHFKTTSTNNLHLNLTQFQLE